MLEADADGSWVKDADSGGIVAHPTAAIGTVASRAYEFCARRMRKGSTCFVVWLDGWIE